MNLDAFSSSGAPNAPMDLMNSRPMALSMKDRNLWYGFIVTKCDSEIINPGQSVSLEVAFLNIEEARAAFPLKSSFLFGDGVSSKGVALLIEEIY